ncbi:hypothetical protein EBX93_08385 [bacterium]|nr:hypothetical protein [bacterium]
MLGGVLVKKGHCHPPDCSKVRDALSGKEARDAQVRGARGREDVAREDPRGPPDARGGQHLNDVPPSEGEVGVDVVVHRLPGGCGGSYVGGTRQGNAVHVDRIRERAGGGRRRRDHGDVEVEGIGPGGWGREEAPARVEVVEGSLAGGRADCVEGDGRGGRAQTHGPVWGAQLHLQGDLLEGGKPVREADAGGGGQWDARHAGLSLHSARKETLCGLYFFRGFGKADVVRPGARGQNTRARRKVQEERWRVQGPQLPGVLRRRLLQHQQGLPGLEESPPGARPPPPAAGPLRPAEPDS